MGLPADTPQNNPDYAPDPERRSFLIHAATLLVAGAVAIVPFMAGLFMFFDPLRRSGGRSRFVPVATLDAVPDDGVPRQFPVIDDRVDAWNKYPKEPIGAVYLIRRKGSSEVEAYNATCPHASCFVQYMPDKKYFRCPCHRSAFDRHGVRMLELSTVPPRDMDSLKCKVKGNEILVRFQNFYTGRKEKRAKA